MGQQIEYFLFVDEDDFAKGFLKGVEAWNPYDDASSYYTEKPMSEIIMDAASYHATRIGRVAFAFCDKPIGLDHRRPRRFQ